MLRSRFTIALLVTTSPSLLVGCPDWSAFGDDGGGDDDDDDGEGGDEGEGEGAEGEGEGAEGEGEGNPLDGPRWASVAVPVTAQAELANAGARRLSSSQDRLFAVGIDHVFEIVDDAANEGGERLATVATLEVPCSDASLTGPVAVDGSDLLVGTVSGALRFHDDGSCEPEYQVSTTSAFSAVVPLGGAALVFDGQQLTLVDLGAAVVDTHAFEEQTLGRFYAETDDAVLLVRNFSSGPGQVVRVTVANDELIITPVADSALVLAGDVPVTLRTADRFGARYVDVVIDEAGPSPTTADLRVAPFDTLLDVASDASGEVAAVGSSALVALADVSAGTLSVTSVTGERFGGVERVVASPSGELWAVGPQTLLYWTAADADALASPSIIEVDEVLNSNGPLRAIDGSLFFAGASNELKRADVDGSSLSIVNVVDNVSFSDVFVDGSSRFAFLPEGNGAPPRLVEATRGLVRTHELSDDLGSVTATLVANVSSNFFGGSVSAVAILDDASKAAFVTNDNVLVTCALELPVGQPPVPSCDAGRNTGVSVSFGADITILDPTAGVDDETFVIAGSSGVGIVEPGEQGRFVGLATDATAPALLVEGCVLGFSSSERSWSALNQDQPQAPAGRRGFEASDALVVGDRVVVVGPADGEAGQIAHFPAPSSSTCADADGEPVLDGIAMFGGEVRSQSDLTSAAFALGELYVLDEDGLLWHVPTP